MLLRESPKAGPGPAGAGVELGRDGILRDYRIAVRSRQVSLLGRREVLTGKAKFGIFGDGKEVAQLALARAMRPGDFRSGYYRDQTLMFALDLMSVEQYFAQLYADPDPEHDTHSAGRQMNAHFATPLLSTAGEWLAATERYNSSADLSPTGSQMPRLVGLAQASKVYREHPAAADARFTRDGNEVAWGTIGNASCAEGMFWEAVNAIGVLQGPAVISIWDDGYGISVPNEHQVTKGDLSALLSGFQRNAEQPGGYDVYTVRGWDYPALVETFRAAAATARAEHVPAIIHVVEMTQPQGHSTSGSHERYKSPERLRWEEENDPIRRLRAWMLDEGLARKDELDAVDAEETRLVREAQRRAWDEFQEPIRAETGEVVALLEELAATSLLSGDKFKDIARGIARQGTALRRHLMVATHDALLLARSEALPAADRLAAWRREQERVNLRRYGSHLYSEGPQSALAIEAVAPTYADDAAVLNGFEVLNACFDAHLAREPRVLAFGEDVGRLGDVNQGFMGLQEKYGVVRVGDTGIRETTIMGQAIGLAMRGLRPIAEIQYLDYLLYALQILSDDLATLTYRSAGRQRAPVIVRTRGHRLEGVWHSGSPMGGILHLVRGLWVCVPRDMTRAAGMYNTLLRSEDPAIVVEVLNGYRVKERLPSNVADFTVPLGVPEVLREGTDVTVVSYGATLRIVMEAAEQLATVGVDAEVIDVQTLLPFDRPGVIRESLRKTHRLLVVDEDVPGGASAFIVQKVLEGGDGFWWLDAPPRTLTAKDHRPPYGSDGDYFAKPNREEIFAAVRSLVAE